MSQNIIDDVLDAPTSAYICLTIRHGETFRGDQRGLSDLHQTDCNSAMHGLRKVQIHTHTHTLFLEQRAKGKFFSAGVYNKLGMLPQSDNEKQSYLLHCGSCGTLVEMLPILIWQRHFFVASPTEQ